MEKKETISHFNNCKGRYFNTLDCRQDKITYCDECGRYDIEPKECQHNWEVMAFEVANQRIQLRKYCTECFELQGKSLKQSDYNLEELPKENLENFRAYIAEIDQPRQDLIDELHRVVSATGKSMAQTIYSEVYLKSNHWIETRTKIYERDNYTCQICSDPAQVVHHMEYVHKGSEYPFELVSLCNKCHNLYRHD